MKNKFLFLVMFLGVALFSACSDDDDKDSPKDLNGIYSGTSTDNLLDLKYSNSVLMGKTVEFTSADGVKGTVKLQGVVPGEKETVFSDIALTPDKSAYTFKAENKSDARTVTLEGAIAKGKLTLSVDVKFPKNELMGKWDLSSVAMKWVPNNYPLSKVNITVLGRPVEVTITTGLIATMAPNMLGKELKNYLQNVTFQEDGNIVATYNAATVTDENSKPEANWQSSALNLAHYCVKEGVCYVYFNVAMIMSQVEKDNVGRSNAVDPSMVILTQLLNEGVPVHFEFTEGNDTKKDALKVYVDEVLLKKLAPLIPLVSGLIPDDATFEYMGASVPIKPILESLPGALEATTEMQVGLNLVAAE